MGEWFWFTLVVGSLPLVIALIRQYMADASVHPIKSGDSLLVACIISSTGVGAVFRARRGLSSSSAAWLGGLGIFLILIDLVCYQTASETYTKASGTFIRIHGKLTSAAQPHPLMILLISVILFLASVLQGATSAWVRGQADSTRLSSDPGEVSGARGKMQEGGKDGADDGR